jgi:type III pantothenate kinase
MKLLVDAGNTRIKWRLLRDEVELDAGVSPRADVAELATQLQVRGGIGQIWLSNVAGVQVEQAFGCVTSAALNVLRAQSEQCGVRNGYREAARLGSDRWAALIGARARYRGACIVANCGTATTVDALSADGTFLGGLILPGIALMRHSLYSATADLHQQQGQYAAFPATTADAIASGAIQATCGAIERQCELLGGSLVVMLSGGAAGEIASHLNVTVQLVDNLVLDGMSVIAREAGKA